MYENNQGALKLATNKHSSKRERHIDVKYHVVQDAVMPGKMNVIYVGMSDQHADMFTKARERNTFERHMRFLQNTP